MVLLRRTRIATNMTEQNAVIGIDIGIIHATAIEIESDAIGAANIAFEKMM